MQAEWRLIAVKVEDYVFGYNFYMSLRPLLFQRDG